MSYFLHLAVKLATEAHAQQDRHIRNIPYICHPLEVMKTLSYIGFDDEPGLIAAVLHDVVEDQSSRLSGTQIREVFGHVVGEAISLLTKQKHEQFEHYLQRLIERGTTRAIVIKLIDRYCNVRDWWSEGNGEKAKKYANRAAPLYEAIFDRSEEIAADLGTTCRDMCLIIAEGLATLGEGKFNGNAQYLFSCVYDQVPYWGERADGV